MKHVVYAVFGPDPAKPGERGLVALQGDEEEAEGELASGLFSAAQSHARALQPGGSISIMLRRGTGPTETPSDRTYGFGSFVMSNPNGQPEHKAHNWDFSVSPASIDDDGTPE